MVDFATNPLASAQPQPSALQQMGQFGQLAQQKIQIDQQKFNLANDHYQKAQQVIGGLASDPAFDPQSVAADPQGALTKAQSEIQNMVKMGILDAPGAAQYMTRLPTTQQLQQNPGAIKDLATNAMNSMASNQEQFNRAYQPIQNVATPQGIIATTPNQRKGTVGTAGGNAAFIANRPSPGTQGIIYTKDQNGNTIPNNVTAEQFQDIQNGKADFVNGKTVYRAGQAPNPTGISSNPFAGGINRNANVQTNAQGQSIDPATGKPAVVNRITSNALPTGKPQGANAIVPATPIPQAAATPPAGASAAPVGALQPAGVGTVGGQGIAGIPLGGETRASADAAADVGRAKAFEQTVASLPQQQATLRDIEDRSSKFESGPMAQRLATAKNFFNQAGKLVIGPNSPQWDAEGAANVTGFHKDAELLKQQQANALGSTATALNSAGYTVPDLSNPSLGNRIVTQVLKGNNSALQAKSEAWQDYQKNNPGGSFTKFEGQFNKDFDPRVYQMQYMNQKERQGLVDSMIASDKENGTNYFQGFKEKLTNALKNKWVDPNAK